MPPDSARAREAIAAAYTAHARAIHRYLSRRAGPDLADDLTAETFTAALAGFGSFRGSDDGIRPWLYGIAGHTLARHRRREITGYRSLAERGADPTEVEGPERAVIERDLADRRTRIVAGALAQLCDFDRDALLLTAWEELTYEQTAVALDSTVAHVRSRIHQARTFLRSYEEKNS
ncbi:RNA polymerase sigma factor [Williamsia sp. CHRR-6]|uniref:RNA polymerase sigma factor n=1 Tax=Williamsia sp. CHRR-6 TaxID=2835871 RepID=UPI001BD97B8C|nr:sigma-70 family RNA polymerase sigma factor [Williamsia sp. CHRR-6]MBT0567729.1 sigma-70 family RNA polymerase sigma factor [Williamsia sp. CHRR-6]